MSHSMHEVAADADGDLAIVSALHMELLGFGPLAALGERFVREICYRALMRSRVLRVMLLRVDDEPAGFVAFTASSYSFHREGLKKHLPRVALELARAALGQRGGLRKAVRAVRWVVSRRGEQAADPQSGGEVVCVAVRPRFLRKQPATNSKLRASEYLIDYAARELRREGVRQMRMVVQAENKAVLLLYHLLGARFEPYELGGEPQVQVWFELGEDGLKR
jgi:ribosomal protein S18 acetylase RimI-like enzyme